MVPPRVVHLGLAVVCLIAAPGVGCRRRPSPPAPAARAALSASPDAAPGVPCPAPQALLALLAEPGRTVRVDCLSYSSYFWAAAALSYDEKGKGQPRLSFVTGGPGPRTYAFDVDPGPTEAIDHLIRSSREVAARVARTRSRQHLVRLGVVGRPDGKGVASDEVALVIQLVAHAAPRLIWAGAGDQVSVDAGGCIVERTVDFEQPFRRDLELFTSSRTHPPSGGTQACASQGPGTQETVTARAVSLRPGRALGSADAGAPR